MALVPAPLFRDPVYDGAADPAVLWNPLENAWWVFYTNCRATVDTPNFGWVHGTDIGIASSKDGGTTWKYEGVWEGLEWEPGRNTFWAPEVIFEGGVFHAYVSYVPGVPLDWRADRYILHYTSEDLRRWTFRSRLTLSSDRCIDACVLKMPSGRWRLWYKDEGNHSQTWCAESDDLFSWEVVGPVIVEGPGHEGANVFFWKGAYWLIVDYWQGLGVWRSLDAESWTRQPGNLLQTPGTRPDDGAFGRHADVLIHGERALIFYFTHPGGDRHEPGPDGLIPYKLRRTSLQVAELSSDGVTLSCARDAPVDFPQRP